MNKLHLLFLAFWVTCLVFYTSSNARIQSQKPTLQFYQHDSHKGLRALESSLDRKLVVVWNEHNSTPTFVGGTLTQAGYALSTEKSSDGIRFLTINKDLFGLKDPVKELEVISNITDELSMTHVKYQQKINGIKIYQGQLVVHFNPDGSIESINGEYFPTPEINTAPTIGLESAIKIAEKKLNFYNSTNKSAELIIYLKDIRLVLAYAIKLPSFDKPMMTLYVDAQNGSIIKIDDGIRYDGPAVGTGVGLDGITKTLHTYLSSGKYYLVDASLPMYVPPIDNFKGVVDTYDALNDTTGNGYQSISRVSDPNDDNNFNDNERLKATVDAHYFSRNVYEFYKSRFNRNSFNDSGGSIINVVHYQINFNNAFWNGICMTYGDGDGVTFSNLAGGYDVIAHEITHGVTNKTANLIYELQSGALNEAVSDIFASIADSANWLIAEDVFTPAVAGDALRNMQDPHNGHVSGEQGWQPAHMSEFVVLPNDPDHDHGGVHVNSGIINKSFYNLASVIGRSKGGLIWYRALTVYLTNNSQFIDARTACLNSAKDIFGNGSAEETAVADAFTAVGIGSSSVTTYDLIYDDGGSSTGVYESAANWELAVKFTPPVSNVSITNVKIEITGDNTSGTGHFTLKMYHADGINNLPGTQIITPYSYTPSSVGWQSFDVTGATAPGDFYVSAEYDGVDQPYIGADNPPGNQKAYEFDGSTWAKLTSPYDYTLFMRATVTSTTGIVEIDSRVPAKFELAENYPNPFNPTTTIKYSIPNAQDVKIVVYDMKGIRIASLVDNFQSPGTYRVTWNGKNDLGESVSSGTYFYRLQTRDHIETKKLLLLK